MQYEGKFGVNMSDNEKGVNFNRIVDDIILFLLLIYIFLFCCLYYLFRIYIFYFLNFSVIVFAFDSV